MRDMDKSAMLRETRKRQMKYNDDERRKSLFGLITIFAEEMIGLTEACRDVDCSKNKAHELFDAVRDECADVEIVISFIRDKIDSMELEWMQSQVKPDKLL